MAEDIPVLPAEPAPRPCRCRRGPCRKGQNNCNQCNSEANTRYRRRVGIAERKFVQADGE